MSTNTAKINRASVSLACFIFVVLLFLSFDSIRQGGGEKVPKKLGDGKESSEGHFTKEARGDQKTTHRRDAESAEKYGFFSLSGDTDKLKASQPLRGNPWPKA